MIWAWMLRSPYAPGTRTKLWSWHGCSGHRMLVEHERNYDLGMDALHGERMHIWTRCVVASAHAAEVSGCVAKSSDTPLDGRKQAPHTDEITTEHRTRPAATPHHHALDAHNSTCHHNGVAGAGGRPVEAVEVVKSLFFEALTVPGLQRGLEAQAFKICVLKLFAARKNYKRRMLRAPGNPGVVYSCHPFCNWHPSS